MCSFLVNDNSEIKKSKVMNKNVIERKNHSEYKDVLLNQIFLTHLMKRIQSKNHRIKIYEINKISLWCLDDKIHILNNGYAGLTLGY